MLMTVCDFIQKYMIDRIGSLIDEYPFESFILMSIGIEYLGKCLNPNEWDDRKEQSGNTFDAAITNYSSLIKYSFIPDLYHNLRCGLVHRLMVKRQHIIIGSDKNDLTGPTFTIGCKDFYADFRQACMEAINNEKGIIKKDLNIEYDLENDNFTCSTQVKESIMAR